MYIAENKSFYGLDPKVRGAFNSTPWTLCVGAGINSGILPTWFTLTKEAVSKAWRHKYTDDEFNLLLSETRWSLDALIQSAANKLIRDGKTKQDFCCLLEDALYSKILLEASHLKLKDVLVKALNNPRMTASSVQISKLCDFLENRFKDTSLIALARCLNKALVQDRSPKAILNFNADTFLDTALDLFYMRNHKQVPKAVYLRFLRSIEQKEKLIPIFHCHGAIVPQTASFKSSNDTRGKLVFAEQEYLDVMGDSSDWAQTVFLYYSQSSRLIIIGHSLSDPNIRRWLSSGFQNVIKELKNITTIKNIAPRHIWINKRPKDKKLCEIMEISLLHLGVRVCWLDEWSDLEKVIINILGIK